MVFFAHLYDFTMHINFEKEIKLFQLTSDISSASCPFIVVSNYIFNLGLQ